MPQGNFRENKYNFRGYLTIPSLKIFLKNPHPHPKILNQDKKKKIKLWHKKLFFSVMRYAQINGHATLSLSRKSDKKLISNLYFYLHNFSSFTAVAAAARDDADAQLIIFLLDNVDIIFFLFSCFFNFGCFVN